MQIPIEEYGFKLGTEGLVKNAHKHNIATHFGTINNRGEMGHLISIGADAIMTDCPHLLKEVYNSHGKTINKASNTEITEINYKEMYK